MHPDDCLHLKREGFLFLELIKPLLLSARLNSLIRNAIVNIFTKLKHPTIVEDIIKFRLHQSTALIKQ
jgi:hypothetical protein